MSERSIAFAESKGLQILTLRSNASLNANQPPSIHKELLDQMEDNPPGWFEGNLTSWRRFVGSHSNLASYLNSDDVQGIFLHGSNQRISKLREYFLSRKAAVGITFRGKFPEWYSEKNDVLPEKEKVEKELIEDINEIRLINDGLRSIGGQCAYLATSVGEKNQRANDRLAGQGRSVFPNFEHFSDLILFRRVADTDAPNLNIARDSLETAIKSYVDSDSILVDQEPIALFIERELKEGKIIQSAQDPIDSHFVSLFQAALESIKAQRKDGSKAEQFENLQKTEKKAFDALQHHLKPFLEILPDDEMSLLEDLLSESEGKPIELFIWDLARSLSSNMKEKHDQLRPGSLINLQRRTTSFLRNHSIWAYNELQESLAGKEQAATNFESYGQPISDVQNEMETAGQEIEQGNLAGWHIFYTLNKANNDPKNLVEIGGKTTSEREQNLKKFVTESKISCSVPPDSIMRTFEWHVTNFSKEVEQMKATIVVGNEEYKLIKRGDVRLFYQMDGEKKHFIFFILQKTAMTYGF